MAILITRSESQHFKPCCDKSKYPDAAFTKENKICRVGDGTIKVMEEVMKHIVTKQRQKVIVDTFSYILYNYSNAR